MEIIATWGGPQWAFIAYLGIQILLLIRSDTWRVNETQLSWLPLLGFYAVEQGILIGITVWGGFWTP